MAVALADSSTLIHLARAGRFDLLADLFDRVLVPPAVWDEVVVQGAGLPGADDVRKAREGGLIEVVELARPGDVDRGQGALDAGEAEAIALMEQEDADVLVLDESAARALARDRGLSTTGLIGLLVRGHQRGHVDDLEEAIDEVRAGGFWIDDRQVKEILDRI